MLHPFVTHKHIIEILSLSDRPVILVCHQGLLCKSDGFSSNTRGYSSWTKFISNVLRKQLRALRSNWIVHNLKYFCQMRCTLRSPSATAELLVYPVVVRF